MSRQRTPRIVGALALSIALVTIVGPVSATEVWSGRTFSFSKPNFANWTQAVNQDRITDNVWLTRKDSQGLFNIHSEPAFITGSPAGTEWATGNAVNHASLTFQAWRDWAAFFPPGTVGVDAVVHLIAEDIFIDIRFDSWTNGSGGIPGGGGFSYTRAVKPTTSVGPGSAAFALRGFIGNPVRSDAQLEFSLPDGASARLDVFDVAGRMIASREVGSYGAGTHRIEVPELRQAPAGLVFVRLVRGGNTLVSRATHLR
jgi:hypothetical protein